MIDIGQQELVINNIRIQYPDIIVVRPNTCHLEVKYLKSSKICTAHVNVGDYLEASRLCGLIDEKLIF